MVSSKQFSILSVFLAAFAQSALGAPLPSGDVALRSEADGDLALRLAIRDLLEDVSLDDRDLESQLSELMARDPTRPKPKRKGATVVGVSGGSSQPATSITGGPIVAEPRPIDASAFDKKGKGSKKSSKSKRAPTDRPKPKRKGATVVGVSGGSSQPATSITGGPIVAEPRPIDASAFDKKKSGNKGSKKSKRAPTDRPKPKRKGATVVGVSGGSSQPATSITGGPIVAEPRPIDASAFDKKKSNSKGSKKSKRAPTDRPKPKRKGATVIAVSGGSSQPATSITGGPIVAEPRPIDASAFDKGSKKSSSKGSKKSKRWLL
ncbi:unnamed protein product [Clonostachys byssicola]|uniref:Uncharacterized protein n=1 Tax=Clonostachys byssicola TaxID=160290 RepID=A0A9N9Y8D3_9HYPO|nr:unnamed protein product [Clonostachys byssicola]